MLPYQQKNRHIKSFKQTASELGTIGTGLVIGFTVLLFSYPVHRENLEWHWTAFLCWCAVKKLLTHSQSELCAVSKFTTVVQTAVFQPWHQPTIGCLTKKDTVLYRASPNICQCTQAHITYITCIHTVSNYKSLKMVARHLLNLSPKVKVH